MASWMGGWRCAGHGASSGIGPKHSTACLVSGSLGGEEACNAWLHHACLRTKGRMVSNHNHEIASLRASRGGGAALIPSPTTSQFVLHTHKPIMHLYPVVIYRTRVAVSTYLRVRVSLVFLFYHAAARCERHLPLELPGQEWRCPRSTVTTFQSSDPGESSADWTKSESLSLARPCKMMNEVNGPCKIEKMKMVCDM